MNLAAHIGILAFLVIVVLYGFALFLCDLRGYATRGEIIARLEDQDAAQRDANEWRS